MFLSRKSIKQNSIRSKVANSAIQMLAANSIQPTQHRLENEVQIVRYPALYYLVAFLLIPTFIYLIYSANGGSNGIPNFNEKLWWQYLLALSPLIVSLLIFTFAQIESVSINKEKISFSKHILMSLKRWQFIERQLSDLINVSILKKGVEKVTFTNSHYCLVFNFKSYEEMEAMACDSQITILEFYEQLKPCLPKTRQLSKRVTIKNIVQS